MRASAASNACRISAKTSSSVTFASISDFNAAFVTFFSDDEHDTFVGLVIAHLGRLPKRGETLQIAGLKIQVLRADSRRVYTLIVEKPKA